MRILASAALPAALLLSGCAKSVEWRFETEENSPRVAFCRVDASWKDMMATRDVVAVDASGAETPVCWALDDSGDIPVLVWLADGRRKFALRERGKDGKSAPPPEDGLSASVAADGTIRIENSDYSLSHPAKGGGCFPFGIRFRKSGATDDSAFFYDRLVRREADGSVKQFMVRDGEDSTARLVFSSPLRAVVEARTSVKGTRITYRYEYTVHSPVVRVVASYEKDDDGRWAEVHTMHMSWKRDSPRYPAYATSGLDKPHPIRPKGEKSEGFTGTFVAFTDGTNAVGVTSGVGSSGWDASSSFIYYIVAERGGWSGRRLERVERVYMGPHLDKDGFSRAFAMDIGAKTFRNGRLWVPVLPLDASAGSTVLEGGKIRLAFGPAEAGFGCLGIESRIGAEPATFSKAKPGTAPLWSLLFWRDGDQLKPLTVDSLAPCEKSVAKRDGALEFSWKGIALGDEPNALDVVATVSLAPSGDAALWRLDTVNRSKHWGMAETDYPILNRVAKPGLPDVLMPFGNWGARLCRRAVSGREVLYPCSVTPVQTISFLLGEHGLQVTTLDPDAQPKKFRFADLGLCVRYRCPDSGVPGAANAPDFPVETAVFTGDWWTAAKRYRAWATRQKWAAKGPIATRTDFNRRLANLGYWLRLGGDSKAVTGAVARVQAAMPGIPLGVHWYTWHQIPFDTAYPEFFPAKPGIAEGMKWLADRDVIAMPYINVRLWDAGIPSFSNAVPAACKKPGGKDFYVEHYHKPPKARDLVPMCPATELWRSRIDGICERIMTELGSNAIYLDQLSSHAAQCYDKSHGHLLGGGEHWAAGYHKMVGPIRERASKRGVALTCENTAEEFVDCVDAFLAWFGRSPEDVPFLPAVYSGYAIYFSSPQSREDSLDSFCATQGRDFLWGCQLGWEDPWILRAGKSGELAFMNALCRERLAHLDFMVEGELEGELPTPPGCPTVDVQWKLTGNSWVNDPFKMPAAMGTVWRARDGRRRAFVVNASGEKVAFPAGRAGTLVLEPRSVVSVEL